MFRIRQKVNNKGFWRNCSNSPSQRHKNKSHTAIVQYFFFVTRLNCLGIKSIMNWPNYLTLCLLGCIIIIQQVLNGGIRSKVAKTAVAEQSLIRSIVYDLC